MLLSSNLKGMARYLLLVLLPLLFSPTALLPPPCLGTGNHRYAAIVVALVTETDYCWDDYKMWRRAGNISTYLVISYLLPVTVSVCTLQSKYRQNSYNFEWIFSLFFEFVLLWCLTLMSIKRAAWYKKRVAAECKENPFNIEFYFWEKINLN